MADKDFGVKKIDLVGSSGTPNLTSPSNLNLNAVTVAISTDVTIGGKINSKVMVGSGYSVSSEYFETTGAGVTVFGTTFTNQLSVSGVSTLTTTDFTGHIALKATSGNSSLYVLDDNSVVFGNGNDLTISHSSSNGVTRIREDGGNLEISANSIELQHSDSTKLETLGAGVTVTGTTFTDQLSVSGVSTFSATRIDVSDSIYLGTVGGNAEFRISRSGGENNFESTNGRFYFTGSTVNIAEGINVSGISTINGLSIKGNSSVYTDNVIITQHPATSFTGDRNVAIGDYSFTTPGAAGENVAIGYNALNVVGNNDTGSTWNGNIGVGAFAGQLATTTLRNTFIGYRSGQNITTGSENTILGAYDGNSNGLDIRTSSNNVVLSDGAGNIRFYANSSGNVGLGTSVANEKLTVIGIVSATGYYGDLSYAVDGRWTLGADLGNQYYTFTGIGFTQTTNNPVLYLARGRVYEFLNNSGGAHPFQIRLSNGGAAYSDGVTENGASSGVVKFEIPFNAPNTLFYQCTSHPGMGNTIVVYPSTI